MINDILIVCVCSVCYDRVPYFQTPLTFVLSALWHGVYPGYYFTFLTGIPITLAARIVSLPALPISINATILTIVKTSHLCDITTFNVIKMREFLCVSARSLLLSPPCHRWQIRRNFRHHFLHSRAVKLAYDVITWAATQLTICYTVMPFLVLAVEPTIVYYRQVTLEFTSLSQTSLIFF